jgi:hypothetical protein
MRNRLTASQDGLALLGSMLLVSMLAVLSTAFLLVMAADVRIAQSHYRNTQAEYTAESAREVVGWRLSQNPTLTNDTWSSGTDSFSVQIVPLDSTEWDHQPPPFLKRMKVTVFSGKASSDLYVDFLSPQQDPRTYFPIAAGTVLELRSGCRVEGGEGVYLSGSDPQVQSGFTFLSSTAVDPVLWVGGDITWDDTYYLHSSWNGVLDIRTGIRLLAGPDTSEALVPQVLLSDSPVYKAGYPEGQLGYRYRISGSSTTYYAEKLPQSYTGTRTYPRSGWPSSDPANNPMGICVWDSGSNGTFSGSITINGTLYCTNWYTDLNIQNCTFTINPRNHPNPSYAETYPALVSKGDVVVNGSGTRHFNGLVYVRDDFEANPSWPDTVYVDGALTANRVHLLRRTVVRYNADIYNRVPGPVLAIAHPTAVLQSRRYVHSLWGF